MANASSSPEKQTSTKSPEKTGAVLQPKKMQPELQAIVAELADLIDVGAVGETMQEDKSGDMGGSGAQGDGAQTVRSKRAQLIANPPPPAVIQQELRKHITKEIKQLSRKARKMSRVSDPGAAFLLNEVYAKIRRLNSLLAEILEASYDVLKRLFIKVFVDNQPIL